MKDNMENNLKGFFVSYREFKKSLERIAQNCEDHNCGCMGSCQEWVDIELKRIKDINEKQKKGYINCGGKMKDFRVWKGVKQIIYEHVKDKSFAVTKWEGDNSGTVIDYNFVLDLKKDIKKHYYCYGYEKQSYIHELLEEKFGEKFPIFGEEE